MSDPARTRILIVDDEVDITEPLGEHLFIEGYQVASAGDGQEAISLIHGKKFDVVILDLYMPNMDGFGVLKYLKGTFPKTKVIVMTGHPTPENLSRCKDLGAEKIIQKPYEVRDILNAIEAVLEK